MKHHSHNPEFEFIVPPIEFNKNIIIVAQTAYAFSHDRQKVLDTGCNDYLAKPIQENELKLLIEKYFGE